MTKQKKAFHKPSFFVAFVYYQSFSICQSIGSIPCMIKKELHFEKCLHPKNPRYAESGDGCGASRIKCFGLLSIAFFALAGLPQSMKTIGLSCSFKTRIAASVNSSQPIPLCELAWCALTVRTVFKSKTPCLAHFSR